MIKIYSGVPAKLDITSVDKYNNDVECKIIIDANGNDNMLNGELNNDVDILPISNIIQTADVSYNSLVQFAVVENPDNTRLETNNNGFNSCGFIFNSKIIRAIVILFLVVLVFGIYS